MSDRLSIALPKGRILKDLWPVFKKNKVIKQDIDFDSRRLIFTLEDEALDLILAKPVDVPTYVEFGAADLGITGKDILMESKAEVGELLDLSISECSLIVAVPEKSPVYKIGDFTPNARIATKYPNIAEDFFAGFGCQVEIIKLNGSIELGPIVGLADGIVDITETGRTLEENNLRIVDKIEDSSARLVVNPFSYKTHFDRIFELMDRLS